MAKPLAAHAFFDWHTDYQIALREFGNDSVGLKLNIAISQCLFMLRESPSHGSDFTERRSCLTALSDLLVLRTLHHRYEAWRSPSELQAAAAPNGDAVHTPKS